MHSISLCLNPGDFTSQLRGREIESWQEFNGLKYLENPGEGVIKKTECTLKYLI
jgi:hypothetical protein